MIGGDILLLSFYLWLDAWRSALLMVVDGLANRNRNGNKYGCP